MTATRMPSSVAMRLSASRISSRMGPPNAFSLSGRFSLIVAIGPAVEKMIVSYIRGSAARCVGNLHLFQLLVLELQRQIQYSFNCRSRLRLSRSEERRV